MKTYSRKKPDEYQDVIIDVNEICRLCMTKADQLEPIFNDEDTIPLALRIMACVALVVFEGDGLPNKICLACKYQLETSYNFRKKCESSDLKLRQHLKILQGKNTAIDMEVLEDRDEEEQENETTESNEDMNEEIEFEVKTEEDLVGVTQVTYIQPDPDEQTTENITLSVEEEEMNKEACTITNIKTEADVIHKENVEETDDQDIDAIAEAVRATLSQQPGLNLSGDLQMKVDQSPGKPTQVQVITEEGSIIIMELLTEDEGAMQELSADGVEYNEDGELKVFHCPDCPKSFARRIQLKRHASVHMQQRGFSCGICEKWFPTRSAMTRHERIHTGERPFQCEVCQKSFAQKEILYRHMMTHSGQKPYNCPHCPKGFTQKEPLRIHLRSHLNTNPSEIQLHYCTLCPKVFCHASGLSRHLITHTGKTFKCRDCDKTFTDKSSLRRHHRQLMHQP